MLFAFIAVDRQATSIPWWMATAIVIGWLAAVAAIAALARKRRSLARARRPEVLARRDEPPDDRSLPAGPIP